MATSELTRNSTAPIHPRRRRRRLRRIAVRVGWVVMTLLAFYVITFFIAPYLAFDPETYFEEQREVYLRKEFVLGVHVLSGILALGTGPFQFVGWIRRRFLKVHRILGVVYVGSATGLGLTGLVLAPTAYTGAVTGLAFALLGLATLFTTWTAVRMVLIGRIGEHRRWMIRSFSLVFAGVMLRALTAIHEGLTALGVVDLSFEAAYAAIAWLCWVPSLLVALWFTRRPVKRAAVPAKGPVVTSKA